MYLRKIKDAFENATKVGLCHFVAITSNDEIVLIYDNSKTAIKFGHINDEIVKRIIECNKDFEKMRNVLNLLRNYSGTLVIHDDEQGTRKLVSGNQSFIDIYYNNIMYQLQFDKYIEQFDKINELITEFKKVDIFDEISIRDVCYSCQAKVKHRQK